MPEPDALRAWHFKQLRWSLQGLALAGSDQPILFPDYARTADELALDFDHWTEIVRTNYGGELTHSQLAALVAIDTKLSTMSRDGAEFDAELWTEGALSTTEHWAEVRTLAASALEAFDWPVESARAQSLEPGA